INPRVFIFNPLFGVTGGVGQNLVLLIASNKDCVKRFIITFLSSFSLQTLRLFSATPFWSRQKALHAFAMLNVNARLGAVAFGVAHFAPEANVPDRRVSKRARNSPTARGPRLRSQKSMQAAEHNVRGNTIHTRSGCPELPC